MSALRTVATWLLIIGGLGWGIEGLTDRDIFAMIAGNNHPIEIAIDILIGLSALVGAYGAITKKQQV